MTYQIAFRLYYQLAQGGTDLIPLIPTTFIAIYISHNWLIQNYSNQCNSNQSTQLINFCSIWLSISLQ